MVFNREKNIYSINFRGNVKCPVIIVPDHVSQHTPVMKQCSQTCRST